jgi:hypothetical protein
LAKDTRSFDRAHIIRQTNLLVGSAEAKLKCDGRQYLDSFKERGDAQGSGDAQD